MFRSGVIELFVCGGNPIDNGNAWYTKVVGNITMGLTRRTSTLV